MHWMRQDFRGRNGGGEQGLGARKYGRKVRIGRRGEECFGTRRGGSFATADGTMAGDRRRGKKKLSSGGEDKVGRRMILESEANYLLPAATAGQWELMDKRFKLNESGVGRFRKSNERKV